MGRCKSRRERWWSQDERCSLEIGAWNSATGERFGGGHAFGRSLTLFYVLDMFSMSFPYLNPRELAAMTDDSKMSSGTRERSGERGAAPTGASPATMREIGGSSSDAFNTLIARQTAAALYLNPENGEDRRTKAQAALAALVSLSPRNELEGMLGAQLIACHNAAMECFRKAADPAQRPQMRSENLAHAGRLSRAYAALVEALDRRRGEGLPKTVTVEHVVIRGEREVTARAAHKGNGHALNGHTALNGHAPPGGTALR